MKVEIGKIYKYNDQYDTIYFFVTKIEDIFIYYYNLKYPDQPDYDMVMWAEDSWDEI